ncbi:MAG: putative toxin-antitoxin system toxin component, PIN family [Sulfuritalea sp.]|nr:putative toxin-antitoxin system toxin component, PIN family [Sulfuritalea sp.]
MRLVLDTNVVASALLWGCLPRLLLQAAREKRVALFTSTPLLAELTDILGRRKFEKKIEASMFSVDQLVDRYRELTIVVRPLPVSGVAPDPDHDVVIGTALAAKAGWIVTGDQLLLSVAMYQGIHFVSVSKAAKSASTR